MIDPRQGELAHCEICDEPRFVGEMRDPFPTLGPPAQICEDCIVEHVAELRAAGMLPDGRPDLDTPPGVGRP